MIKVDECTGRPMEDLINISLVKSHDTRQQRSSMFRRAILGKVVSVYKYGLVRGMGSTIKEIRSSVYSEVYDDGVA